MEISWENELNQEITNARRLAQTSWIALAIYTLFGFHQIGGPEVEVSIGGNNLIIPKRVLDWGFPIFSLYSTFVCYYIAFQKNRSPGATRKHLRKFKNHRLPVELMTGRRDMQMGIFRSYIANSFPKLDPHSFKIKKREGNGPQSESDEAQVSMNIPYTIEWPEEEMCGITKFLCLVDTIHYAYPFFLNIGFLILYLYYVLV